MDEAGVDPYVCEKLSLMLRDTNFNVMQEERRSVRLSEWYLLSTKALDADLRHTNKNRYEHIGRKRIPFPCGRIHRSLPTIFKWSL